MKFANTVERDVIIPFAGQLSRYPEQVSLPMEGIAIKHPQTRTVDLYFSFSVENPKTREDVMGYLNLELICNKIGVGSLTWDYGGTLVSVTPVANFAVTASQAGRGGLKIMKNTDYAQLGRAYTDDLTIIGGWYLSSSLFGTAGVTYCCVIPGASYT